MYLHQELILCTQYSAFSRPYCGSPTDIVKNVCWTCILHETSPVAIGNQNCLQKIKFQSSPDIMYGSSSFWLVACLEIWIERRYLWQFEISRKGRKVLTFSSKLYRCVIHSCWFKWEGRPFDLWMPWWYIERFQYNWYVIVYHTQKRFSLVFNPHYPKFSFHLQGQ